MDTQKDGTKDHPRSRGEYTKPQIFLYGEVGSSPLSRGILPSLWAQPGGLRIIPALAGNTEPRNERHNGSRDHPRSRGEYFHRMLGGDTETGSSPLSRGIPARPGILHLSVGIIPALAGNTPRLQGPCPCRPDHPRSRGEYVNQAAGWCYGRGSSPLSRGIPRHTHRPSLGRGIIPALAGNTKLMGSARLSQRDHPRSRGEYVSSFSVPRGAQGSSPLSRGIRNVQEPPGIQERIIPALAGNTTGSNFTGCPSTDHPRSRGEYSTSAVAAARADGSSPLSRGIQQMNILGCSF